MKRFEFLRFQVALHWKSHLSRSLNCSPRHFGDAKTVGPKEWVCSVMRDKQQRSDKGGSA